MSRSLLLADDARDVRAIVRVSLERLGDWSVTEVDSGHAALAVAHDPGAPFDAVLLDVMMPDLDGLSTLRGLALAPRTTASPVVFLTAKTRPEHRRAMLQAGAVGVILKPFDPLGLPAQLDRLLGPPPPTRRA